MFQYKKMALACTLFAATHASANTYLSIEGGLAYINTDTDHFSAFNQSIEASGGSAQLDIEDSDTVFAVGIGHQYSSTWGVEFFWLNLGTASATSTTESTSSGVTHSRSITERTKQSALTLSLTSRIFQNEQWLLQAGLGLALVDQKASGEAQGESVDATGAVIATESESSQETSREWAPVIGIKANYRINHDWQVGLGWRRISHLDPGLMAYQDVDLLTTSLTYQFK